MTRQNSFFFIAIISKIKSLSVVVADKAYDSEDNHDLVIETLHGLSIMPARYEGVPVWKTHGRYRKGMKRGYNKILYNQRNKDETIVSVIKRLFGEHITSRLIRMQNRELILRCIAYNVHRMVKLVVMVMVSTQPTIPCLLEILVWSVQIFYYYQIVLNQD
jgi:hypothetical protein